VLAVSTVHDDPRDDPRVAVIDDELSRRAASQGMRDRGLRYSFLRRFRGLRRFGLTPRMIPEGAIGLALIGHRDYVGGMWETMGKLQFDFMVSRGLEPQHVLLDIACGSLRAGRHFIRYLEADKYLGIEKEGRLIRRGVSNELPRDLVAQKHPEFVVSGGFAFERFSKQADFSLAQSLFTHLSPSDVELCLVKLRANVGEGHAFYATFAPGRAHEEGSSHARASFHYSADQLSEMGRKLGWRPGHIGDWAHPRQQIMMSFTAC
jgi:hypothetical protein